jgi:phospholipid N-methyltransferase
MSQIAEDVLRVLSTCEISGNNVKITAGQLDRKLYLSVNEVLNRIGGRWMRQIKAHVFDADPTDRLNAVIESGVLDPKVKTGYFPTPAVIVDKMIELADISRKHLILEPSAGQGHIADRIIPYLREPAQLILCEKLEENRNILLKKGYSCHGDFFNYETLCLVDNLKFDRILMNPPFERQADIDHVTAAYGLLEPGGILVTIMSTGVTFRENKKSVQFRENIMEPHGTYLEHLPSGAFKESGTQVRTILLRLLK